MVKQFNSLALIVTGLVAILLAACAQATAPVEPTPPPITIPPVEEAAPTIEPTVAVMAEPEANECLDCHTDKERIIANLAPEEEVIKESEGVG